MILKDPIEKAFRLSPLQKIALSKLRIKTVEDLLFYFPTHYGEIAEVKLIQNLSKGDHATLYGKISKLKMSKAYIKKIPMAEANLEDESGHIKMIWFHQPYITKMITEDGFYKVEGNVSERKGQLYITNPDVVGISKLPTAVGDSIFGEAVENFGYPVYSESRGITSKWFYYAIQKIFQAGLLDEVVDPIPAEILKKYNLPTLKTALFWIHEPKKKSDADAARKRFAFEEVFFIQLANQRMRLEYEKEHAFKIERPSKDIEEFVSRFPFKMTNAQQKAVNHILEDFKKGRPMARLLEGDVGSGKTAVAACAVYATTMTNPGKQNYGSLQTAYMVPTEILAKQHFESFIKYFSHLNISIGLLTGSECRKFPSKVNPSGWTHISKAQLKKWVANGEIAVLIGTHALIQKSVTFKNLANVIIDEQHRFGTSQRQKLTRKDKIAPHLLSMTATPIPRTLALTIFGDLDLTLLDEMPAGRKIIITEIVTPDKRNNAYEKIEKELESGRQLYIICPRIDEPDPDKEQTLNVKSVTEEAKRLKREVFPKYEIAILHSKMKPKEKEKIMNDFYEGRLDILVSTSVVEVGVNVPNATVIIIEGAERFGLAQLHQLRGRVLRSNHQAYCFVFAEAKTKKTLDRLRAFKNAKNGFELAEYDLAFRGPGELSGVKQWGLSDLGMEAIKNIRMVEAARLEAQELLKNNPELISYSLIKKKLESKKEIHFE
ncbi:MAG: ATP-dependent DNA helicase RecG [Candidatus Paceibacterota bacterium]